MLPLSSTHICTLSFCSNTIFMQIYVDFNDRFANLIVYLKCYHVCTQI